MTAKLEMNWIIVQFEEKDWKDPKGGASMCISAIKRIGHWSASNDRGYRFMQQIRTWELPNMMSNRKYLQMVMDEYLTDHGIDFIHRHTTHKQSGWL